MTARFIAVAIRGDSRRAAPGGTAAASPPRPPSQREWGAKSAGAVQISPIGSGRGPLASGLVSGRDIPVPFP